MNIKYDNSMYTTNPPSISIEADYEEKYYAGFADEIEEHEFELQYENGFIDIEEIRIQELIKYESKRSIFAGL